ncbi:hypothetical protein BU649_02765 [Staphylococcus chromogenes]|uniref:Zinc finger LSD1-type domain-containing protein n=1 Tax=Staphylococcus chromogenes TaxID=46126 RepID=A0AAE5T135_STACR|nr:hypothetical protein BUY14_00190 [Staphylococcus chromogenes]PTF39711.1 hypothetical protein BUY17_05065 [Staphylococcus chromogenes]PTF42181.1 hypothetical protein BUY11_06585 [Staphylococcus chromogenes]PTF48770.1 hypothetical protein BUY13_05840 [Staphylococcus chromogenes]PTF50496.1 hypothetical protein BUY12_10540 [Staphylococcus chromogenes]
MKLRGARNIKCSICNWIKSHQEME